MPDKNYQPSKKAQDDFWSWLSEYYDISPTILQLPEALLRFGSKSNQYYQYWEQYIWTPAHPTEKPPVLGPPAPGPEETKKVQAHENFMAAGGTLSFAEWLKAGEPNATDEGASNAWLDSLAAYLQAQIDSRTMSFDEAILVGQDMEDRLFGLGKYEGARQTILELPAWVRTDVENYRKNIPIQEQRRLDEAAQTAQQQAQDIASQRMKLPLGAGGTIPQQIQAGQLAIRNLQIQLEVAPDYMHDILKGQIADLEKGISQLRETDLAMAKERAIKMGWDEEAPAEPVPGPDVVDFAEKYSMSPEAAMKTAQRYVADRESVVGEESGEFTNLTREQQRDLSVAANEEEQRMSDEAPPRPVKPVEPFGNIPRFEELGVAGSPTWKRWFEQRYPTIVSQFRGKEERTEAGWTTFLETERARIKAEFTKQTPYARGERPGAFAPKIKTVAW